MNPDALIIAFPFIPLLAACAGLAVHAIIRRDISRPALWVSHGLQLGLAAAFAPRFFYADSAHIIPLSPLAYPITYAMDRVRVFFLLAYLVPLFFSLFRIRRIESFHLRILLLFYLGGCSGVIVAGDLFNFFVTYEVMIMAAYVLIGARRRFYASVKYMIFGAVSSSFFLAGIVVLYASGAYLGFGVMERAAGLPPGNLAWMLVLFGAAFFVKAAFFPASSWVATCHSATISPVSAFLASFTIFSGIFGLYHLVLVPAVQAGQDAILAWVRVVATLTMVVPAFFVYFEPDLKRCVAGSTVYTTGLIGLLLAYGFTDAALAYMVVHAVYKSLMFYLLDGIQTDGLTVSGSRATLIGAAVCVLFTAGTFPTLAYFLKADLLNAHPGYLAAMLTSMTLVAGGFFKFRPRRVPGRFSNRGPMVLAVVLLALAAGLIPAYGRPSVGTAVRDFLLMAGVIAAAHPLAVRLHRLSALDRRWLYPTLNAELLAVLVLFTSGVVFLWWIP